MVKSKSICKNCIYVRKTDDIRVEGNATDDGIALSSLDLICVRFPPTMYYRGRGYGFITKYPRVKPYWVCCGEFKLIKE